MRVAWVVPGPIDQRTGGYIYDALVVDGLRARGDRVDVVSIDGDSADLAARIDRTAADLVVGDALASAAISRAFPRVAPGTKRVLLVHHCASWETERSDRGALAATEAAAITASDQLIATSAWTARRLAEEHACEPEVVVPGADRLAALERATARDSGGQPSGQGPARATSAAGMDVAACERSAEAVELLFVGSFLPRKRLLLLLDALVLLADPRLRLRLIGDPARDPEHGRAIGARIVGSPYLRDHVTSLGLVEDRALVRELRRAEALILPASLEGYGMVLAEAIHAGVPVLATRASAMPEAAGEGEHALFFEGKLDGADGLVASLRRFAGEPGLRVKMRAAARARAVSLPTWSGAVSAFRAALERLIARAGGAPRRAPDP